jgi:predicted nucleic acid-binding protein
MSRVDPSTLLFFDVSCLIAAAASPSGGAGFLWGLCQRGFLQAAVSQAVLIEAASNLGRKFDPSCLERRERQLQACAPHIAPIPLLDSQPRVYPHINPKDEHVVAAALAIRADVILTLDQPLAGEIDRAKLGIPARSPGDFIRLDLITHPLFSNLRQD